MEKFKLTVDIDEVGAVSIKTEGLCHHVYLVGVLESIKNDVLIAAAEMTVGRKDEIPEVTQ